MTLPAQDISELQQLANRYWALADLTEDYPLADLFVPDAVFELGTLMLKGLPAIEDFFAKRAEGMRESGRTTRHLATNFLAIPEAEGWVRIRSTVMVYAGNGEHPLTAEAPSGIADFEDLCQRGPAGRWLYRSRCARTVFIGPNAASFAR